MGSTEKNVPRSQCCFQLARQVVRVRAACERDIMKREAKTVRDTTDTKIQPPLLNSYFGWVLGTIDRLSFALLSPLSARAARSHSQHTQGLSLALTFDSD